MNAEWMPDVAPDTGGGIAVMPAERDVVEAPAHPAEPTIAAEVESWLRAQTRPEPPVLWCRRGEDPRAVRGAEALAAHVGTLTEVGDWALAHRDGSSAWTQCMRVPRGWIVEVNGVPGPDNYARRVRHDRDGRGMSRRVHDHGQLMAIYATRDVVATASAVAEIMWSWLRGSLPEGYTLRDLAA